MKSNAHAQAVLDLFFLNTDYADVGDAGGLQNSAANGNLYIAFHTAFPGRAGTQATSEASYTGYARAAVPRDGTGFTRVGRTVTLAAERHTGTRTDAGAAQELMFWSIGLGAAGATAIAYLGAINTDGFVPRPFSALDDTIRAPDHGLVDDDRVVFFAADDADLPAGITEGTVYFLINANPDDFQVSATEGGAAVNVTADGSGRYQKVTPVTISQNHRPTLLATAKIVEA